MDPLTLNRIQLLHPAVRQETLMAYTHINKKLLGKNIRLRFTHTLRTINEQNELYALGRTKPGKKVTNAKGGKSIHNYGLAFDIVLLVDRNSDGYFESVSWDTKSDLDKDGKADWMEVVTYFKSKGWQWGGNWKSFPDYPHFDKTMGHTSATLMAKLSAGDVFTEVINSITYKWVNL